MKKILFAFIFLFIFFGALIPITRAAIPGNYDCILKNKVVMSHNFTFYHKYYYVESLE